MTFTVTIKNQGFGNAGSFYVYYFIDGAQKDYDYLSSLSASGISSQTFTWSAQTGTHTVKAVADYNGSVPESDETNNQKEVTFSGTQPIDLIIQDITWYPADPSTGQTVTFTVIIKNRGFGNAGSFWVYYFIDGAQEDYDYLSSLSASDISSWTFNWSAQTGTHTVKAVADYDGWVPESNETNNDKAITIVVP